MSRKKIVILTICVVLLAVFYFIGIPSKISEYETNVNEITKIDSSSRQEAVDAIVEDGMIRINYQVGVVFDGVISESFHVENNPNNQYPLVFELLDKVGNVLYKSKMIRPGYEINKIKLEKSLPKGLHECKIKIGYAEEGTVFSVFPITIQVK